MDIYWGPIETTDTDFIDTAFTNDNLPAPDLLDNRFDQQQV